MYLVIFIIYGLGVVTGWYAYKKRDNLKKWVKGVLRKANTKANDI